MEKLFDCRDAFASALEALADKDPRVVAVCNDSVGSSKLGGFKKRFPDRLINVGIAEQNMIGVAAGLANGGRVPFVCAASCFLTGRALEQIKADLAYAKAKVVLCGMSSGMAYGELGPTHHSIEDLAWTRAIADLAVVVPADPEQTRQATNYAHSHEGPLFLRLSRMGVAAVYDENYRFAMGRADQLREGRDLTLIANGTLVGRCLAAADRLASLGLEARVLNVACLRPLDTAAIVSAAQQTGAIVTAEEHTTNGGLGGAVAEVVVQHVPVPMALMGVPGVFAPTGSAEFLLDHFGMDVEGIVRTAFEVVARKRQMHRTAV